MRILLISRRIPYPLDGGYPLRVYNLLRRTARQHEVWLATFISAGYDPGKMAPLREFCAGIETAMLRNQRALSHPVKALLYCVRGMPPDLKELESAELSAKINGLMARVDFDVVQIEDSHMAIYLDILPKEIRSRTLLTFHDVNFKRYDELFHLEPKKARKARVWLSSHLMRHWEPEIAEQFAKCITVSDLDRCLLLEANPRLNIGVVPNGVDTYHHQLLGRSSNIPALIFVGNMAYRPNADAAIFFCNEIFPLIKERIAQAEFWIVGRDPANEIAQRNGGGVHVTGRVDDVCPYYAHSAICVVPLRAGGGTRLKILEAMALGRAVVSTSIGCEGLEVVNGEHLLIADTPREFAEKALLLLRDLELRNHIITQARQLVVNRYDWEVITQQLLQEYLEVAKKPRC